MDGWYYIRLTAGRHNGPGDGLCLMEAVALFVGERHSDWPTCVCPVLIEFGRALNDAIPDEWRTKLLLPLVPTLVGTRDPQSDSCGTTANGLERDRAAALLAWCVNRLEAVVGGGSEAELHAHAALTDAAEALRFGQAQHAARTTAAGLACAVRAIADRELAASVRAGKSPQAASRAAGMTSLCLWRGAVDAYRNVAGRADPPPRLGRRQPGVSRLGDDLCAAGGLARRH